MRRARITIIESDFANARVLQRRDPHLLFWDCVHIAGSRRLAATVALLTAGADDPDSITKGTSAWYSRRAEQVESKLEARRPVCQPVSRVAVTSRPAARRRSRPRARASRSSRAGPRGSPDDGDHHEHHLHLEHHLGAAGRWPVSG